LLWRRPIAEWRHALALLLAALAVSAVLAEPTIVGSAIAYGATFMAVPAAVTALIKAKTAPADWTPTLAAFTTLFAAGQTAGPWLAGIVADHTSAAATWAWTAVLCAAAAVVVAPLPRKKVSVS
jgi:predicted MFS family arabinose efflux permease